MSEQVKLDMKLDIEEQKRDAEAKEALCGDMSFKEELDMLEEVVSELERGDLELEASLEQYSLGVKLLTDLQKRLIEAQQKVDVLMGQLDKAPDDETQDTTLLNA